MLAIRRQTRVRTRAWWFIACLPAICLLGIWYGKIVEASAPATPRMTEQVDSSGLPPPLSSLLIPNDTPTGTPTPCGPSTDYTIATATATIVPGTVDIGLHCGSCLTNIALPFPVVFYGTTFSSANVGTNSTVQFSSANASGASVCLPDAGFNNAIIPLWRNLRTDAQVGCSAFAGGCGIFTSVSGSSPNRIFNVEWRAVYNNSPELSTNFEVRLYESGPRIDFVYGNINGNGSAATVGIQRGTGAQWTQYSCGGTLSTGLLVIFTQNVCPTGTPTPTRTITPTPTQTPCGTSPDYVFATATATIVPGTVDTGSHCGSCTTGIALPFPVVFYGNSWSSANVGTNGTLQFASNLASGANNCLPDGSFMHAIIPFWRNLRTDAQGGCSAFTSGCGIFTSVSGSSPNRILNVEWRAVYNSAPNLTANFEVRLYESSSRIDFVYGNINGNGGNVTVGIQKGSGVQWTQFSCNNGILSNGLEVIFTPIVCATSTPTITPTPTPILVGHVTWQGPPAQPSALQQLPITLTLQMGATQVNYPSQNTDASGFFTVSLSGLASGTYTWRAKGPKYLSNSGTVAVTGAARTNQEMGLMRAGDANNDNVDNSTDFSILRATYGKSQGQPGYDDRADFTGDLAVSALDFSLMRSNFGSGGASPPGGPGGPGGP